jgi:hypothetical protein
MTETALTARLTSLPAELRNLIYSHVVVQERPIRIWTVEKGKVKYAARQPSLATTCKTFRNEVLPIYYGQNTFIAGASGDWKALSSSLDKWLETMHSHLPYIHRIGVSCTCDRGPLLTAALNNFGKLDFDFQNLEGWRLACTCSVRTLNDNISAESESAEDNFKAIMRACNEDVLWALHYRKYGSCSAHSECEVHGVRT